MRSALLSILTLVSVAAGACASDPVTSRSGAGTTNDVGGDDTGAGPAAEKVIVTTEALDVEGTSREYVLAVPKELDPKRAYPLVLVFHGDGGSGPSMRKYHTFDAVSGDEALVAYPSGIDQGWDMQTPSATNGDIKFVESLVASLSTRYTVDTSRVFGTGHSSGAFLVNKIACRKTGFFRGIVSHGGGAPDEEQDPNASRWPSGYTKCAGQTGGVAAMIVHGDKDKTVTLDSGDFDATYWASLNGCKDTRTDTTPSPCKKHDGCPMGEPVLWCLIPGLGHTVWKSGITEGWAFMKAL
jgi:polyhydroxybutyrate depolymerase